MFNSEKLSRLEMVLLVILVAVVAAGAAGFGVYYFQQPSNSGEGIPITSIVPTADELPPLDYTLYFYSPGNGVLAPEVREGPAAPEMVDRIRIALAELARGPETSGLVGTVTSGLALRAVYREPERGLVYVDLGTRLLDNTNPTPLESWAAIYSVVNTVCDLSEEIDQVMLLQGGAPLEEPLGGWEMTAPFEPETAWVRYEERLP